MRHCRLGKGLKIRTKRSTCLSPPFPDVQVLPTTTQHALEVAAHNAAVVLLQSQQAALATSLAALALRLAALRDKDVLSRLQRRFGLLMQVRLYWCGGDVEPNFLPPRR